VPKRPSPATTAGTKTREAAAPSSCQPGDDRLPVRDGLAERPGAGSSWGAPFRSIADRSCCAPRARATNGAASVRKVGLVGCRFPSGGRS
jgi:hypothetical protein